MFKLVVLFAVVAIAVAKPGYLHGLHGGLGYHALAAPVVAAPIAIPAAVSYTHRADIIHKPIISYATVPVVKKVIAAPIPYAHAPLFAYPGHHW